jgi:hypothetical protein
MRYPFFNKYTALSIGAQFIAVALIWIADVVVLPIGDSIFELIFYFYLPAIFLISTVQPPKGESGMIASAIDGITLGFFLYGFIFGFVVSSIKRLARSHTTERQKLEDFRARSLLAVHTAARGVHKNGQ